MDLQLLASSKKYGKLVQYRDCGWWQESCRKMGYRSFMDSKGSNIRVNTPLQIRVINILEDDIKMYCSYTNK